MKNELVNIIRFKEEGKSQEGGGLSFDSISAPLGTKFSLVRIMAKIKE